MEAYLALFPLRAWAFFDFVGGCAACRDAEEGIGMAEAAEATVGRELDGPENKSGCK
jgi:hypothetical protein